MRKHHKITLAFLALLATLPFFVQADRPEPPPAPDTAPQAAAPQTQAPRALVAALPVRAEMPQWRGDPFSPEALTPRHGTRRVPAAALRPVAPPIPYRFAGELRQPGATRRFLARGNDILEVKRGDVLDDGYRVDAVEANQVVLIHLASGLRQTIASLVGGPAARIPPKALREG